MAEHDLWLANATHANAMAQRLAAGICGIPGLTITQSVDANAVFVLLPREVAKQLLEQFHFYIWNETTGEARWMTSWATAPEDVDEFVAAIAKAGRG
jgi:threonine aldolase